MAIIDRLRMKVPGIRRSLKWARRGILVLVGLFAIAWTLTLVISSSRLESRLKEIAAQPDLAPPDIKNWDRPAPGQNAAPLFSAAMELLRDYEFEVFDHLERFISTELTADIEDPDLSPEAIARLKSWLDSKQVAFDLVAQAAARPWCRYLRYWSVIDLWRPWITEAGGVRLTTWALIARARFQAMEGRHREARESVRLAFAAAESLRDEPFYYCHQFRNYAHQFILDNVSRIVPKEASAEELTQWLQVIPDPKAYDGWLDRALRWEIHTLGELLSEPIGQFWSEWGARRGWSGYHRTLQRRLADPLVKLDGIRALDHLVELARSVRLPYPEGRAIQDRLEAEKFGRWSSWAAWNPVRAYFVRWMSADDLVGFVETRAMCRVVRTGLEWEKMRLETGKYPERSEAIDPLTGKPLLVEASPARLTSILTKRSYHTDPPPPFSWVLRK